MAAVKIPQGDLASPEVTLRERVGFTLQYSDAISLVLPFEIIPEPVTGLRGPRAAG